MWTPQTLRTAVAVTILVAALAPVAVGSPRHRQCSRCGRTDVDIESLKAELRHTRGWWELSVRYEVEIEDAHPAERFELVLTVTENSRLVCGRRERPLTWVVPLRCPSEWDRNEVEFKDRLVVRIPQRLLRGLGRLRLKTAVVRVQDGRVLDTKSKSIKLWKKFRPRRIRTTTLTRRTHRIGFPRW